LIAGPGNHQTLDALYKYFAGRQDPDRQVRLRRRRRVLVERWIRVKVLRALALPDRKPPRKMLWRHTQGSHAFFPFYLRSALRWARPNMGSSNNGSASSFAPSTRGANAHHFGTPKEFVCRCESGLYSFSGIMRSGISSSGASSAAGSACGWGSPWPHAASSVTETIPTNI
jgi:hypothetical protein